MIEPWKLFHEDCEIDSTAGGDECQHPHLLYSLTGDKTLQETYNLQIVDTAVHVQTQQFNQTWSGPLAL